MALRTWSSLATNLKKCSVHPISFERRDEPPRINPLRAATAKCSKTYKTKSINCGDGGGGGGGGRPHTNARTHLARVAQEPRGRAVLPHRPGAGASKGKRRERERVVGSRNYGGGGGEARCTSGSTNTSAGALGGGGVRKEGGREGGRHCWWCSAPEQCVSGVRATRRST